MQPLRSSARRFLVALLAALTLAVVLGVGWAGPVAAAPSATSTTGQEQPTTTAPAPESGGIIPEPNSGVAPQDAGDRGGALQTVLFAVICGGVLLIGALVVRESRAARAKRGF